MVKRRLILLLSFLVISALRLDAREGFGFSKKAVDMIRTIPPGINANGSRIQVIASSDRSGDGDDAQTLRRYTEESILSGDKRFSTGDSAEVTVRVVLNLLDANDTWEQKTETKYQKVGTRQEWNSKRNKYETKDVYDNVEVTKNVKAVTGTADGTYRISDKTGRDIDHGGFLQKFNQKYDDGTNAPAPSTVRDDLLHRAARVVAGRLVPTNDRVTVIAPKGSFEALIPLAESGNWDRYLAGVEAVPENHRPDQEAYRQYALAIAKEAVAYTTEDVGRATQMMSEAVEHYRKAIAGNPEEKMFSEAHTSILFRDAPAPLPRAETSLAAYQNWKAGPVLSSRISSAKTSTTTGKTKSPGARTMRNETVIEMSNAGLSDETVKMAIDAAPSTHFDVTPDALIALARSGVSKPVIAYMQKAAKR